MTRFTSVTPNLLVRDVAKSLEFYRDVLGFKINQTVPGFEPFVFVMLERDGVMVFLNDISAAALDYPAAEGLPAGGTAAMFFMISGVSRHRLSEDPGDDAAQDAVLWAA
jgi:catechol 2,3-dioxygenase-like lactoylglutathione lyase family enzyme